VVLRGKDWPLHGDSPTSALVRNTAPAAFTFELDRLLLLLADRLTGLSLT